MGLLRIQGLVGAIVMTAWGQKGIEEKLLPERGPGPQEDRLAGPVLLEGRAPAGMRRSEAGGEQCPARLPSSLRHPVSASDWLSPSRKSKGGGARWAKSPAWWATSWSTV